MKNKSQTFALQSVRRLSLLILIGLTTVITGYAQNINVNGKVVDENGELLPGATIIIEGTTKGVITDMDGNFQIDCGANDVLVCSFIGYVNKTMPVEGKTNITFVLKSQVSELDDVTVVAFAKQKKESVLGSITTVKPAELKVPSSNLTTALAGRMSGIISYQRSGEPGADNAEFFIRGVTTFGYKTDPLILIDGIESSTNDLARMQPDDIASFSIMKDATATALYGARGANGVILITTKEGQEGRAKISVRYEKSLSTPTQMLDIADPITYMKLHNEAIMTRNPLDGPAYSYDKIKMTQQPNRNQNVYPAVDWQNEMFEDYALNDRFNFNVNGGGKVARYYLAATVNTDRGILKENSLNAFDNNVKYNKISLRSNVNIYLTSTTEVSVRFSGNFDDYTGPIDSGETLFRKSLQTSPVLYPMFFEPNAEYANTSHILFGNAGQTGEYLNPYADMVRGYRDESRSKILATVELKQDLGMILKGLDFRLLGNTTRESFYNTSRSYNPFYYSIGSYNKELDTYTLQELNPDSGSDYLSYNQGAKAISTVFYGEAAINWNRTFSDLHNVTALLVGTMRETKLGNAETLAKSLAYRNMGVSGRFTYAYDSRYFVEANFGYNGSERFAANHRYGFFPSVGVGWMISNEEFWQPLSQTITKLKLKGTYGLVGSDAIGDENDRFFYISSVNMKNEYNSIRFGEDFGNYINGISIDRYSNDDITWETAKMTDIGLEVSFWDKIDLQADYFYQHRSNVLMDRSEIPSTMGLQSSLRANLGEVTSGGIELALDVRHSFNKDFWLTARGNFTYATNEYKVYEELDYVGAGMPWLSHEGQNINQKWGLIAERLFVDEADIANSPTQTFGPYMAGDIKYKDINEDGVIDNNDRAPIGFPEVPEINYGFGFSTGYKTWDLSMFFQGSARSSFFIDPYMTAPFIDINSDSQDEAWNNAKGNNALLSEWANDHWSENDRDIYAAWPRLSAETVENNNQRSTWFLRNGSFLRLKSVEVGYTLPKSALLDKLKIANLRFYLSGTNLACWSGFKLWDVEMGGNGLGYPI
ncbi:MAG: TonB-dependent receptor [Carboxylicivirga sp.]|jgi:TonB-linked SusC/RagA family outer membrane protein|nr:TonB-dependent receptor [Carboxylicivirga sp.]